MPNYSIVHIKESVNSDETCPVCIRNPNSDSPLTFSLTSDELKTRLASKLLYDDIELNRLLRTADQRYQVRIRELNDSISCQKELYDIVCQRKTGDASHYLVSSELFNPIQPQVVHPKNRSTPIPPIIEDDEFEDEPLPQIVNSILRDSAGVVTRLYEPLETIATELLREATELVNDLSSIQLGTEDTNIELEFNNILEIDNHQSIEIDTNSVRTDNNIDIDNSIIESVNESDSEHSQSTDSDEDNMAAAAAAAAAQAAATTAAATRDLVDNLRHAHDDNTRALLDGMGNLSARALLKDIPTFSGENDEGLVIEEWIKVAERVAASADWTNEMKLRFFQHKLTKSASNFNETLAANQKDTYDHWKTANIDSLQDTTTKAIRKEKLKHLRQMANERVRDFKIRIDDNYKIAYGHNAATSRHNDVRSMRDDTKKDILLKGLRQDIAASVWTRIAPNATFDDAVNTALECEKLIEVRKIAEQKDLSSVVTVISKENEKNAEDLKDLKDLVEKLIKTSISAPPVAGTAPVGEPSVVAAFHQFDRSSRTPDRGRVRFADDYRSRSRSPFQSRRSSNFRPNSNRYEQPHPSFRRNWADSVRCWNCNKQGHYSRQCRKKPMQSYRPRSQSRERPTRVDDRNDQN